MGKFVSHVGYSFVKTLCVQFETRFAEHGYQRVEAVPISSGVDPSVRFVGSPISVLKPLLLEGGMRPPGVYIIQPCLRTTRIDCLADDSVDLGWGSHFICFGGLFPSEELELTGRRVLSWLLSVGVPEARIQLQASDGHPDLQQSAARIAAEYGIAMLSAPTVEDFVHGIGVEGVVGETIHVAFLNERGRGRVFCNIIRHSRGGAPLGVEISIGATALAYQVLSLPHIYDAYPLFPVGPDDPSQDSLKRKLQDCIVSTVALCREGLVPGGSSNQRRLLRAYLRHLKAISARLGWPMSALRKMMVEYEVEMYGVSHPLVAERIMSYVQAPADHRTGTIMAPRSSSSRDRGAR